MIKNILTAVILIFLTSACSMYHLHSEEITDVYYPSKESGDDVLFVEEINQPHEIIGMITVNAERRQKYPEVLEKLKHEAAVLGADAITDIQSDSTGDWKKLPAQGTIGNAYIRANFSAVAVVFK